MKPIATPTGRRSRASLRLPDAPPGSVPLLLSLDDPRAVDPAVTGAKAGALARARVEGLPTLPGFAITTAGVTAIGPRPGAGLAPAVDAVLRPAWEALSAKGAERLVVRSSSTAEDGSDSSMAGQFSSVLDVRDWASFLDALEEVMHSNKLADRASAAAPMAILVQPQLECAFGGVMFGLDPVSGRTDRIVVAAVKGGPDRLVSGEVDGTRFVLSLRGRRLSVDGAKDVSLKASYRRALVRLASAARSTFGTPQDVEWAIDPSGDLWLFQSRPITSVGTSAKARGPILGAGPVAETFPDRLFPLERELWIPPLKAGVIEALLLTGSAPRRRIAASPVITTIDGVAVADLDLLGFAPRKKSFFRRLDPRPPARRLAASWRVGRLKAALPTLAEDLCSQVDNELQAVPRLAEMPNEQLLKVLRGSRQVLVSLHGHEVLAGLIAGDTAAQSTAAALALRVLSHARSEGFEDAGILADHPVVLALTPPAIRPSSALPETPGQLPNVPGGADGGLNPRESLRLRARWVHELTARAASELANRMLRAGFAPQFESILLMTPAELENLVRMGVLPAGLEERKPAQGAPLPVAFQLDSSGNPVPVAASTGASDGIGAGGGRGSGRVHSGPGDPPDGAVLVVATLDPSLAPVLPRLAGLVSETGSVLSHLAILAREFGVPTVVGVRDAATRFPHGAEVVVDGTTGEVELLREGEVAGS